MPLKGSLCLCCIYINAMLPTSKHWRVHLSFGFSSCKWTPPSQIRYKHLECEQRQSFWCRQGREQNFFFFFSCAHAFVILLRGMCFWFQGCSVMNKVSDERSQAQGQIHSDFRLYTAAQHRSPAAKEPPCWWNITGNCFKHYPMLNFVIHIVWILTN